MTADWYAGLVTGLLGPVALGVGWLAARWVKRTWERWLG